MGACEFVDSAQSANVSPAATSEGTPTEAGRMPIVPKIAMMPAAADEQPIVGQSHSCVPCLSPCTGHAGAL